MVSLSLRVFIFYFYTTIIMMCTYDFRMSSTASFHYFQVRSRQCDRVIKNVVRPCMDIVPVSYIISSVSHLTDALCRLYDRWEVSSLASDPEFHHALFALVGRIKWLTKDLHATSGTCDQMVLLVREYDECQIEYMRLMEELNDNEENSSDDSMKMYFSKAAKNNLFEN